MFSNSLCLKQANRTLIPEQHCCTACGTLQCRGILWCHTRELRSELVQVVLQTADSLRIKNKSKKYCTTQEEGQVDIMTYHCGTWSDTLLDNIPTQLNWSHTQTYWQYHANYQVPQLAKYDTLVVVPEWRPWFMNSSAAIYKPLSQYSSTSNCKQMTAWVALKDTVPDADGTHHILLTSVRQVCQRFLNHSDWMTTPAVNTRSAQQGC